MFHRENKKIEEVEVSSAVVDQVERVPKKQPRWLHIVEVVGVWLICFVVLSGMAGTAMAYYYKDRFYPGAKISGINLSNQKKDDGVRSVREKVSKLMDHQVVVTFPDITQPRDAGTNRYPDSEIKTTAKDLGLQLNQELALDKAWQIGHSTYKKPWLWARDMVLTLFKGTNTVLSYTIEQKQMQAFINTQVVPKMSVPTPAKVSLQDGKITMSDPKTGLEVDSEELARLLANNLDEAMDDAPTYLRAPVKEVEPTITRQAVQAVANRWEAFSNLQVTLTDNDKTFTPKKTEVINWFMPTATEKGEVYLSVNQDNIDKYLITVGKNLTDERVLTRKTTLDNLVKLINKALQTANETPMDSVVQVPAPVNMAVVATKKPDKPTVTAEAGSYTPGMFEGKYIEVNLAEQKMYLLVGSTLEQTYRVSTGAWATPTPKGTFHINGKSARAYSAAYGLYMPYWQNFLNGEYGIHGLPEWPNGYKEGENHLGIPVSHGCIRLGGGADAYLYNWTETGTPVYIH